MPRPIWKGFISFGLVTIPVNMLSIEEKAPLHFHLLDSRDQSRVYYQRINKETGKEVPWEKVVKAYEIEKDKYVIMDENILKKADPEAFKSIEIEEFVHLQDVDMLYFDKPYYLLPEGKNKKAYVLLREALKKTNTVGIGKIIIKTKEYLSLILSYHNALVLNLIRFKESIIDDSELNLPNEPLKTYKITKSEVEMAIDLINSMTSTWKPEKYHDEYRENLMHWINKHTPSTPNKRSKQRPIKKEEVVDFIDLLKKSMQKKKRIAKAS